MGILGAKCHTQIREDLFPRITQSRKSKTRMYKMQHTPQMGDATQRASAASRQAEF
jgi:hypothetical protein